MRPPADRFPAGTSSRRRPAHRGCRSTNARFRRRTAYDARSAPLSRGAVVDDSSAPDDLLSVLLSRSSSPTPKSRSGARPSARTEDFPPTLAESEDFPPGLVGTEDFLPRLADTEDFLPGLAITEDFSPCPSRPPRPESRPSSSASPTPNSRSGARPSFGGSKSEVSFESDGTGGASACVAGARVVPSGSDVSPGVNRKTVFFPS